MRFDKVFIPYSGYWTSPFCRWQGGFSHLHSLEFAARCGNQALLHRGIELADFGGLHLGTTVPQHKSFWGAPWVAAMMGAPHLPGPTIAQACATSARLLASSGANVELGASRPILVCAADRTSNGPHLYHPDPHGPGGRGRSEDWVWDNFNDDPYARVAMVETAENTARSGGIGRREQDELTLRRYEQYTDALADDADFQKRYMLRPVTVSGPGRSADDIVVPGDEGVKPVMMAKLESLQPVIPGGTVTFASQTHPADGNAGMIVCSHERARDLASDPRVTIQLRGYGEARVEKAHMGQAPVPAARAALEAAGLTMRDIAAVKTHNPFVVNDLYFAQQMGIDPFSMNNYGSSLIYGHPQAPTGLRAVIELIEELHLRGGGHGLFTGCAAGDSGAAIIVTVT